MPIVAAAGSHRLWYGRRTRDTNAGLLVAGALFVVFYLFWRLPGVSETAYDVLPVDVIGGGIALLLLVAAVQAARNQGLLVSWLLVYLPFLGATLNLVGVGFQSPSAVETVGLVVAIPLAGTLIVGTAGYLLGRGTDRVLRSAGAEPA